MEASMQTCMLIPDCFGPSRLFAYLIARVNEAVPRHGGGKQILNSQLFKALPACELINVMT